MTPISSPKPNTRRHYPLPTGGTVTPNLPSPQLPRYFHPSHNQLFQYSTKPRSRTNRRYLAPLQNSCSGLISPRSKITPSDSSFSLPAHDDTKIRRSFGQSSLSVKMGMRDEIGINLSSVHKLRRVELSDRVFGGRREVMVPQESCLVREESTFDPNKEYFKPTEISRLVGDLNKSSILMRYDPTFSLRRSQRYNNTQIHNNNIKSNRSPPQLIRMMKMSRLKMKQSTAASEFEKIEKIKNTVDDYKKQLEQKRHELDPIAFKNTISHVLAFDQILKKIKKPMYLQSRLT